MSVQGDYKDEVIGVEYISKKGKNISTSVNTPMGRKIRQAIIKEKQNAKALKDLGDNGKISKNFVAHERIIKKHHKVKKVLNLFYE